jgi:FKBP-type peptidyl-prolyl cis-trans isomerase 2
MLDPIRLGSRNLRVKEAGNPCIERISGIMKKKMAQKNSKVKIFYHGTTLDNKYLLSNKEQKAFEFTIGSGSVPEGFEDKIIGMAAGEKREFTLHPEEGFGERKKDLITTAEKSSFPDQSDPQIGKKYRI